MATAGGSTTDPDSNRATDNHTPVTRPDRADSHHTPATRLGGADTLVTATDPGVRPGNVGNGVGGNLGGLILGATAGERQVWLDGRDLFLTPEFTVDEGLGPRFNFMSCFGCHPSPAVGGTSGPVNPQAFVHQQFPGNTRQYSFVRADGPVREARVIKKPDGSLDGGVHALFVITGGVGADGCQIEQEDLDAELARGNLTFRIPTPFFGAGLIENITDAAILENAAAHAEQSAYSESRGGHTGSPATRTSTGTTAPSPASVGRRRTSRSNCSPARR